MSMSTPINQIRSRMTQQSPMAEQPMMADPGSFQMPPAMPSTDNNGMLEDILREMERTAVPDTGSDPNVGVMNYAINPVNIPPPMNQQAKMQLQAESTQAGISHFEDDQSSPDNKRAANNSMMLGELTGGPLGQKILATLKPLVLVFLIVLVLSLHQTNRFLFSFFPQLLLENGQLSIFAILLRCAIATVLFYVATLVIN